MGVEVGVHDSNENTNEQVLERRRRDISFSQECKDLESMQKMVCMYLNVKPWSNSKSDDPASWTDYIMPYSDGRRKPASLRNLLNSICVRHSIDQVEHDVSLPPLKNRTVYLKPSWHDKLNQNAFIFTLITNAVTSNRCDEDYM